MKSDFYDDLFFFDTILAVLVVCLLVLFFFSLKKSSDMVEESKSRFEDVKATYQEALRQPVKNVDDLKSLSVLLTHGVPDRYDNFGMLIPGVEPNHPEAVMVMQEVIDTETQEKSPHLADSVLRLADLLYVSETARDLKISKDLYERVLAIGNRAQKAEADDRLQQIDAQPMITGDIQINVFPLDMLDDLPIQTQAIIQVPIEPVGDSQNVHDSKILKGLKDQLDTLPKSPQQGVNYNDILAKLNASSMGDDQKRNAQKALDSIFANNESVMSLNTNELGALQTVWSQVKDDQSKTEAFLTELSEMVEHGHVVCATGRIARIVDTLNIIDPEKSKVKPKWALQQEILDKTNVLYKNAVDNLSTDAKNVFEADTLPKARLPEYEKLADDIKQKIVSELEKEYVTSKLITQDELQAETQWLDSLFLPPEVSAE